ncbi:uncharacterized protein Dwil_GK24319 [Drosophila willistoni]|uniref:MADF domain-containing protein n=1 Tax=Drosophila willistoni TaxID=7260 RepID=B4MZS8_DROWI|nr:uncharacterized protein Dwil_GK24319 [Drosophila willistoni]
MNFNPASVVAAAAAAAHSAPYTTHHHHHSHHPHLHNHIIPLPSYSSQPAIVVGVGGSGGGSGGGGADSGGDGGGGSGASAGDSSPKIMEWTNDDALELIEQYRCHTELWNRADPKYKDKLCRFRAWSEIAERFGCSKAEVERKMNVLLTQYRREKHKMFVKIYQGIQPNPSKWYAFKRFDFMEAGGGSLSGVVVGGSSGGGNGSGVGGGSSGPNIVTNPVSTSSHNGLNGLAAAAVAAAAYENSTIAAAANGGAPIGIGGVGATNAATSTQQQQQQQPAIHSRRMKTKELKYFGAMGLSIPMLIAGGQTLDSWNTTGQYSPPIGGGSGGSGGGGGGGGGSATGSDRGGSSSQQQQQLRVPLPMTYGNAASTPYPGGSGGGGGSSSSEFQPSPHKTMDTSDNEDTSIKEDAAAAAALGHLEAKVERRSPINNNIERIGGGATGDAVIGGGERGVGGGSAGGGSSHEPNDLPALSEAGSSPIPNTNMHEAHKNHLNLSSSSPGRGGRSSTPRQAHEQLHHHHHTPHHHSHHLGQRQDDMDIKQELVDYFHAPNVTGPAPPPPPESHLSYSSAGEERDMAQDLRVAQAKANFVNAFALPPSSASVTSAASGAATAAMPLNMRKLTAATSAGHMLMTSLLNSRESVSDGDNDNDDLMNDEATESAASPGHIKSSVSAQDARAAAAALYAESLQRDDCDFIGSNVSMKLRTMDRTQRIIAEKLISEVLYYGQFNELERTARIQPK